VGPSILVAILGVVTIGMVYFVGREWFGKMAGAVAAFLYAVAPTVIIFSRASWNPNVMPFFALLSIYAVWRTWREREFNWLIVLGVAFAFVMQSHYLGLVLAPVLGLFWLLTFRKNRKEKVERKKFWRKTVIGLSLFLFLMSPLVIFDARHGWNNFGAIKTFFAERQTTVSIKPWKAIPNAWPIYEEYTTRLLAGRNVTVGKYASIALISLTVILVGVKWKKLSEDRKAAFFLLLTWLLSATIALGLYKQHIYDHYYGFFFAAPFLLLGAVMLLVWESKNKIIRVLPVLGFVILLVFDLLDSPIKGSPVRQLQRSQEVVQKVIEVSGGERYNFALIAERNYEAGYRYFMDVRGAKVVDIDPQNTKDTITDQLLVVCEMEKEKCDPTHNAKAEVAAFGWSKVESQWNVSGITLYKLVHTQ
jgi:4-amino-4-deoxy-L-arabinose transferase-like glycosyltransferase